MIAANLTSVDGRCWHQTEQTEARVGGGEELGATATPQTFPLT